MMGKCTLVRWVESTTGLVASCWSFGRMTQGDSQTVGKTMVLMLSMKMMMAQVSAGP